MSIRLTLQGTVPKRLHRAYNEWVDDAFAEVLLHETRNELAALRAFLVRAGLWNEKWVKPIA